MSDGNKPVITPIGRQKWIVGEDFKVEIPISNVDTVSAEGPLYGGGVYSWNKDQGILTITGHADKEISSYVDVIAKKGDRQAKYTIHFKCRPLVDKFNRLVLEIQEVSDTQNAESGCLGCMSHQSNTPDQREIEGILNEIKSKSTDGNYIYRGERKLYCKVSSAFYRQHQEIINTLQNDPIGGNAYSNVFDNFDLRLAQKEELKIAKNHIGETRQDIFENPKDAPAEHQRTTLKADEVDLLTQLQHYGGKTNLIDFTTDYLIATYFACAGEPNEDGRVIVLEKTPEIESMIIRPSHPQQRVIAQKSIFLYPPKGFIDIPEEKKVTIPSHLKQGIITYLHKYHGISVRTIYNDIHGFITYQNIQKNSKIFFLVGLEFHGAALDPNNARYTDDLYEKAIKYYTLAIELNSEDSDTCYNRGECQLHLGNFDQAREDFKIAKDMGKDIISAFHNEYQDVADFEHNTDITLPPDIAEMLGN